MHNNLPKKIKNKEIPKILTTKSRWLYELLWELHNELRNYYKRRWNRDLPFCEEVFDRWERASYLGFGKGTNIHQSAIILGNVKVGKNTWIGPFTYIDGEKEVSIGSNCSISAGVHIYSHETAEWAVSKGKVSYLRKKTVIGDYSYLGAHSVIRAGVTIGKRCVIGACTYVNRNVPDNSIVFGSPARIRGQVIVKGNKVLFKYPRKRK